MDIKDFSAELIIGTAQAEFKTNIPEALDELKQELVVATPVDTGNLRDSWQEVEQVDNNTFRILNTAEYASYIFYEGLNGIPNSKQLPDGIEPVVINWVERHKQQDEK